MAKLKQQTANEVHLHVFGVGVVLRSSTDPLPELCDRAEKMARHLSRRQGGGSEYL